MRRHTLVAPAVVMFFVAVVAGCGSASRSTGARSRTVTVFAAASLTEPFRALEHGARLHVTFSFAGSQTLERQIEQGAPADVFASADEETMRRARDAGVVGTSVVFARNRLEIAVAAGNPKHVTGLTDLARRDLTVVLPDPSVPAGRYARRALDAAHVVVHPRSLELDVKSTLAKVASGEADAAVVYVSDVATGGPRIEGVPIPAAQNVVATYPIAIVKDARHGSAATAFVALVLSGHGEAALRAAGFLAPR